MNFFERLPSTCATCNASAFNPTAASTSIPERAFGLTSFRGPGWSLFAACLMTSETCAHHDATSRRSEPPTKYYTICNPTSIPGDFVPGPPSSSSEPGHYTDHFATYSYILAL